MVVSFNVFSIMLGSESMHVGDHGQGHDNCTAAAEEHSNVLKKILQNVTSFE